MAKPRKEKEGTETGSKERNEIGMEEYDQIRRVTKKQIYDDGAKKKDKYAEAGVLVKNRVS
jgi:hypothetical protein